MDDKINGWKNSFVRNGFKVKERWVPDTHPTVLLG